MAQTEYNLKAWREGEGDPRIEIVIIQGSMHDPTVLDLDTLADSIRNTLAARPDIVSTQVVKAVTDTVVTPL